MQPIDKYLTVDEVKQYLNDNRYDPTEATNNRY
jgi:hypothetical protein